MDILTNFEKKLSLIKPKKNNLNSLKQASVIVPYFLINNSLLLVLLKRSNFVRYHKGEISFPGGMNEKTDKNLQDTALREFEEELGISRTTVSLMGRLDDVITKTKFLVTPFVGRMKSKHIYSINTHEVDEILEIPIDDLINENVGNKNQDLQNFTKEDFFWKKHRIFGATLKILLQFAEVYRQVKREFFNER